MTETVQSVQAQMQSQVQTQAVARMQEFSRISAPRPVLIRGEGGEQSALSTVLLARLLPQLTQNGNTVQDASDALRNIGDGEG